MIPCLVHQTFNKTFFVVNSGLDVVSVVHYYLATVQNLFDYRKEPISDRKLERDKKKMLFSFQSRFFEI